MKLKQRFPLLVMTILSVTLLVVLPLVNFFVLRSQTDALQQLGFSFQLRAFLLTLTDGLWKAVLILVCIWLGVGIYTVLQRIKDTSKRRLVTTGVVFGSLFLCVVLPILGLVFTYKVFSPKEEGWVQLPTPPATAKSIAGAVFNQLIIETEDGHYFSHGIPDDGQGWQADEKPDASFLPEMDESASPSVDAPGTVISMIGVPTYPGSTQNIYFAILEDHTVWYLPQSGNAFFATALLATVTVPILVAGLLMLFGMGLAFLLNWFVARIWRDHTGV